MAFTYVTVTRDYDLADGEEPVGTVTFTPTVAMVNSRVTIVAAPVRARLDTAGVLSISLAANTDPGTDPVGAAYLVEEYIFGARTRRYYVQVPHDLGATVDLSSLPASSSALGTARRGLRVATGVGAAQTPAARVAAVAAPGVAGTRVNLCANPHADISAAGWFGDTNGATFTRVNATGFPKSFAVEAANGTGFISFVDSPRGAVTTGTDYVLSTSIKPASTVSVNLFIEWRDAGDTVLSYTSGASGVSCAGGAVTRPEVTGTAPASATQASMVIGNLAGVTTQFSAVLSEPGTTANSYADGDTSGWEWSGTAGLSASDQASTPGGAAGTGTARDATVDNRPRAAAGRATGSGGALAATGKTTPHPGVAAGTGAAHNAGVSTSAATGLLVGYSMPDDPKTVAGVENEILGRWTARSTWAEVAGALYLSDTELPAYTAAYPGRALDLGIPLIPHDRSFDGSTWNADLDSVISGAHDADHVALGGAVAGFGPATVYARPWWEFDAFGELHVGGLPDLNKFKAAWQRAIPNIRAGFAAHARTGQVLKINYSPLPDRDDWASAYPGDAYVDVISPDIYGKVYSDTDPTESQMLAEVQGYLDNLVAFGALHGKPIAISEWANVSPKGSPAIFDVRGCGDCPAYINLMFDWALAHGALYLCYYDSTAAGVGADLDTTPSSKAAFVSRTQAIQATTAPGVPTIGTATADYFSAVVTFTPPVGGARVATYTATSTPGSVTATGTSSPITVGGLTSGTSYTFTVHATNAAGSSAESAASNSATVPTPVVYAADSFTRADGAVGSTPTGGFAWTVPTGISGATWAISSNHLQGSGGGQYPFYVNTGHADGTVALTRVSGSAHGLAFRVVDKDNYWVVWPSPYDNIFHVLKVVAGSETDFGGGVTPVSVGSGEIMSVVLKGNRIIAKADGTTFLDLTDSALATATRHGAHIISGFGTAEFDNFSHNSATS